MTWQVCRESGPSPSCISATGSNNKVLLGIGNDQFNVAYNIAKEELPFTKFKSDIILMKKNGLNVNPTYSNEMACAQFIAVIGDNL